MEHERIMYKCQFRLLKTLYLILNIFLKIDLKYMYGFINENAIIVLKKIMCFI